MNHHTQSIWPFIGARDYEKSRNFYCDLGCEEVILSPSMSLFRMGSVAFYLQNAYMKDWVDNTMVFVEVDDVSRYYNELSALNFPDKYPGAKLTPMRTEHWGCECFLHDPSGI